MPSFADLQAHIRQGFKVLLDEAERFAIAFRVELEPGRPQAVTVQGQHELHNGESWLYAYVEVCEAKFIDPAAALARNAKLRVGALAIVDGRIVVQHAWPLSTFHLAEFDRGAQYLALTAAALLHLNRQRQEAAAPVASDPIDHFSD